MSKYERSNGTFDWTRIVYAIKLNPTACTERRSPCGGASCGKTPVYIGETALSAEERLEQHRTGYKASRWVKKFGCELMPDLYGMFSEMRTVEESRNAEATLADRLREDGRYCVYGGH